eukprot:GFYU01001567.1.p1 GENE.GFYU01001567.1~~GFYU01001567.1.p1  ORF type:complete len:138 (-),score=53.04 GFYU01001567.1:65-478(-)
MFKSLFVSAALIAGATAFAPTDCGSGSKILTPTDVVLDPPQPVRGADCTTTLTGNVSKGMNGGKVNIKVSYLGVVAKDVTDDLCADTACPVNVGTISAKRTLSLPSFSPPGKYTAKIVVSGEDGSEAGCATFDFNLA